MSKVKQNTSTEGQNRFSIAEVIQHISQRWRLLIPKSNTEKQQNPTDFLVDIAINSCYISNWAYELILWKEHIHMTRNMMMEMGMMGMCMCRADE